MLDYCDAVISLGGTEGVYRLGLFAAGTKKLFIPFALADGTSKQLVKEIKSLLEKNYTGEFYPLISRNKLEPSEINQFVQLLNQCIEKKEKESLKTINQEEFLKYIDENPESLKNLSPHYVWKLLKKLPFRYWLSAIAFIILFVILEAINIYNTYILPITSATP